MIVFIICIFAIIELITCLFLHVYYSCESHLHALYFIESSGFIGFLSTLFYFILKELKKTYTNMYLILSNVYFVSMICIIIYWLISLTIESRRFMDDFHLRQCQLVVSYFLMLTIIGNYLIFFMLIIYALWLCYFDVGEKQGLYSHATLIH